MNSIHLLVFVYILITVGGGLLALFKKDYFTRGVAITFLTGVFGILAMALSTSSKARRGDNHDQHYWPERSYLAVLGTVALIALVYLISKLASH
jgi:uncharacterized membrane-anchored protein